MLRPARWLGRLTSPADLFSRGRQPTRLRQSLPQPGSPPTGVCYHYSAQPPMPRRDSHPLACQGIEGCTQNHAERKTRGGSPQSFCPVMILSFRLPLCRAVIFVVGELLFTGSRTRERMAAGVSMVFRRSRVAGPSCCWSLPCQTVESGSSKSVDSEDTAGRPLAFVISRPMPCGPQGELGAGNVPDVDERALNSRFEPDRAPEDHRSLTMSSMESYSWGSMASSLCSLVSARSLGVGLRAGTVAANRNRRTLGFVVMVAFVLEMFCDR